jgi:DNA polymerase-3 subunit epsilon
VSLTPNAAAVATPHLASFVAIDFETADPGADSACAVGLVKVVDNRIVDQRKWLIRPPRQPPYNWFPFTRIHRITWDMVADSPSFSMLWPEFAEFVGDADCLVAHNARFDRGVLHACCVAAGLPRPAQRFACTVELARIAWKLRPTRLPDCCRYLGIRLNHHDPLSDALACAQIAIAAAEDGIRV